LYYLVNPMATPRQAPLSATPLGMKPALKAPLRSLVTTATKSRTATKPRSTTATKSRTAEATFYCVKLVLSLRRAKPEEPSPRVLRRVRLPLNRVLLHIRSRQDRNKAACFNHKGIDYESLSRTAVKKPVSRSTTRKVGGGAGCGSENWVGLTPVNHLLLWRRGSSLSIHLRPLDSNCYVNGTFYSHVYYVCIFLRLRCLTLSEPTR
jgi:hypothetical protein